MSTKLLQNLLCPPSRLPNSFPWSMQTAGKKYVGGLARFVAGSLLAPALLVGVIAFLGNYLSLKAALDQPQSAVKLLSCLTLFVFSILISVKYFRLRRQGSSQILRALLLSVPFCLGAGLSVAFLCKHALAAFAPYHMPCLNWMLKFMTDGGSGKPDLTFIMLMSVVSFVMGFGWQVRYIAREMQKSGISLAKAMALTFEPLKGSWWGATLVNVLLPVGVAYGLSQVIGLGVVHLMGPAHQPTVELAQQATGSNFVLFALMAVLGAPILEEIVFRGFLFQVIRCSLLRDVRPLELAPLPATGVRRLFLQVRNLQARIMHEIGVLVHALFGGRRAELSAIVLSSLMFSLLHLQFNPTTLVMLFLLGCVQAEIYRRTGSLYCGMMLHALNNGIDVLKLALGQA